MHVCCLHTGLLHHGVCVACVAKFYVETFEAGTGPVAVGLLNPLNQVEQVRGIVELSVPAGYIEIV